MRVRILRDMRNYTPNSDRRLGFRLRQGEERTLRRIFGEELVALGVAEEIAVPPRDEA